MQCAVLELDAWREEGDADELLQFVCRRIALRVVVEAQEGRRTLHGALCSRVVDGVWQEVVVVLVGAERVALELRLALALGSTTPELSSHHCSCSKKNQKNVVESHVIVE